MTARQSVAPRRRARRGEAQAYFERVMAQGDQAGGCWLWPFGANDKGYGQLRLVGQGRDQYVHRLAFERVHGRLPHVGRHTCDTPACFNPSHVLDGTHADNTRDMIDRGRDSAPPRRVGEAVNTAKLTPAAVVRIRSRLAEGATVSALARDFGVDRLSIRNVRDRRTWAHVDG